MSLLKHDIQEAAEKYAEARFQHGLKGGQRPSMQDSTRTPEFVAACEAYGDLQDLLEKVFRKSRIRRCVSILFGDG